MADSPYLEKIRTIRKLKNLDQAYMASRLGLADQSAYSKLELGKVPLSLQALEGIAEAFEMTVPKMLGFDEGMVFQQCQQDHSVFGTGNHFHEANAALVEELRSHVRHLEEAVKYLRELNLSRG